jgi:hypothetical protein
MSWVEETDKKYWFPDVLPELTDEWNQSQERQKYVTNYNTERMHPRWIYDNGAFVDDDYLYYNESWRRITNANDVPTANDKEFYIKNPIKEWAISDDDKTISITWKTYKVVEPDVGDEDTIKIKATKPDDQWILDHKKLTITKVYEITRFTDEELNTEKWNILRGTRDLLLKNTDYLVIQATETGKLLTTEIKQYRQQLRDLPEIIGDVSPYTRSMISARDFYPPQPSGPYLV